MTPKTAMALNRVTRFVDQGKSVDGFEKSELRACLGGEVWRRFEPRQKSKAFGSEYESWEVSGSASGWLAEFTRSFDDVRPSRIDLAFDFDCPESFRPDDLIPHLREHAEARGIDVQGISGARGKNTRYVGSVDSDRRLRIYRRDWKDETISVLVGPVLRIELILRREQAAAFWPVWAKCTETGFDLAAGHVLEMTGLRLQESTANVPPLELPECRDEASRIMEMLRMYGDSIAAWFQAGVPIVELCQDHQHRPGKSRQAEKRQRERLASLGQSDIDDLVAIVRRLQAVAA